MAKADASTGLEPYVLALVLCDFAHVDPVTGKWTLLGTFHEIAADSFPVVYPHMAVYVALTEGRETVPVTIRLVDVDEAEPPISEEIEEVEFADPQTVCELAFEFPEVVIDKTGIFRLQLLCSGTTILE